ncbi:hypothetical protein K505DRAFT_413535 [Melanomma pulvis-pyrius CBS 109.77]|uniref:Cytochrome b5 heme-binding domain-containing protein n=1 Tax=Melanomma pulvis-pyrius CBS 109.77 TaxID=1314802 RepID=A0A6A6XTA9_9PLEO|nr:hypothetical protein K505DRAFT_413535 [Melanomma pulvis-pyrius CBS 109.77]
MAARYRNTASTNPPLSSTPPSNSASTPSSPTKPEHTTHKNAPDTNLSTLSVLDILRVIGGIFLLSSGMSYLVNSGESMTWGYNPWWTRAREWRGLMKSTVSLTDAELLAYDGSDPTKPIYLALNGTIYDVSANRPTYAPGGSYHFFAGRDAARAFLTGCFQEDQTADLRGVEMMYMPVDPPSDGKDGKAEDKFASEPDSSEDPVVEAHHKARAHDKRRPSSKLSKAELKNRHSQELRKAKKQVREGLEHWHALFRGDKGKPYFKVGEVKREKGWLEKLPKRALCETAEKGRPVRKEDGEA